MRQEETFHDPHKPTAPMRVVYVLDGIGVKPRHKSDCPWPRYFVIRCVSFLTVISLSILSTGCLSPGKSTTKRPQRQATVVVAVQYIPPGSNAHDDQAHADFEIGKIREDFNHIKKLGFDTVLMNRKSEDIQSQIASVAVQNGLNIDFNSDGTMNQSTIIAKRNTLMANREHNNTSTKGILGSSTAIRANESGQTPSWYTNHTVYDHHTLAMIDLQLIDSDPHYSASAQIQAQYHRSLSAGKTRGIVVRPFRPDTASATSLLRLDQPLNPSDQTAITELMDRVKLWGTAISGMYARPLQPIQSRKDVDVTVFFRGRRQYLMIFNPHTNRYARGRVGVDPSDFVHTPHRAVELSARKNVLGNVAHARDGVFTFSIELRPGDAVLYEMF